jgi:F0F1-type ATP synthase beta subunit
MPDITSIIVEEDNLLASLVLSPVSEDGTSTVGSTTTYDFETGQATVVASQDNFNVEIALVDNVSAVTSVNGKTGAVVIDYPDIGSNPVNHVRYTHIQSTIATEWTINHNLNFYPNVTVLDNSSRILETDIVYLNANTVKIIMNSASSGTAYLT